MNISMLVVPRRSVNVNVPDVSSQMFQLLVVVDVISLPLSSTILYCPVYVNAGILL